MAIKASERGFALVSVLLLTMMVFLTAAMVLVPSLHGKESSARSGTVIQAGNTADAALDFGLAALNSQIPAGSATGLSNLPTFFRRSSTLANTWTYEDGGNNGFFRQNFTYVPTVTIVIPTAVPLPSPLPNGASSVAGDYRIVTASSTENGALKRVQAIVQMQRNGVTIPYYPFTRAITARGNLTPNGNDDVIRTDSYNSGSGPYGGTNVASNGGVHVNGSILDGAVYAGNVTVSGVCDTGVSVSGAGNTLTVGAPTESIPDSPAAPTVSVATAWTVPGTVTPAAGTVANLGAININGAATNVLRLNPGRYVCSSISLSGNGSIEIVGNGLVEIFCTGNIDAAGNGIANASARPTNLVLNATNPAATVNIAGNGTFYGGVQAPGNNVTIAGNGAFYGAIVGNNVVYNGSNSVVHYDEAMGLMSGTTATIPRPAHFRTMAINVLDRS